MHLRTVLFALLSTLVPFATIAQEQGASGNYNSCLHGYYSCNPSQLTETEQVAVRQAAHQRNYSGCLRGYSSCNPSQLNDSEKPAIRQAAHQRNYNNCLHGYVSCDISALTESEKTTIASRSTSHAVPQLPPRYYTNKDGQRVQSPTYYDKAPAGATAQCRDGTYSFSQHHQGTCSHHGGVAQWLD